MNKKMTDGGRGCFASEFYPNKQTHSRLNKQTQGEERIKKKKNKINAAKDESMYCVYGEEDTMYAFAGGEYHGVFVSSAMGCKSKDNHV